MACPLTQGFELADCEYGAGGIKEVYITEFTKLVTLTEADCLVSALDIGVNDFYKYSWADGLAASYEATEVRDEAAGTLFYQTVLNFQLKGLSAAKCAELRLVALNRLLVIIKDNEDKYWLIGSQRGALKVGGTNSAVSGGAFGEFSGYNIGITDNDTASGPLEVPQSVIDTLSIV